MTETVEVIHMTDYDALIRTVVSRAYRRYRPYVDFADLMQEAAVWWYGKGQKYLPTYITDENLSRISISIYRYVEAYARSEKAAKVGFEPRDQYPYQPREVADLIPIALDPEGLPLVGYPDGGTKAHGNLAEGGDILAALVDVRRALHALPEADVHFLTLADDCSYDWERVAVRLAGGVPDSMRRRFARIAERMARWLSNQEDDL